MWRWAERFPSRPEGVGAPALRRRLTAGWRAGLQKGWTGFCWMLRILVPVSLASMLLQHSGLLALLDPLLTPLTALLHLPPSAALPLLAGMLTGIYGGIAAMATLPLSTSEMTLVAIFLLISHNLIQEGIIQGKSGLHPLKATLVRLAASVATVLGVAPLLPRGGGPAPVGAVAAAAAPGLPQALLQWGAATLWLAVKILVIIVALMILLEILKQLDLVPPLVRLLWPLMRLMGLERRLGLLWLTAVIFGVAYGAAVIVEEAREGRFGRRELERLQLSIGINHSMVEDPLLFLSLGLGAFWLWVPRLITAVLAVLLFDLWHRMRPRASG
jgi:hypothetical protein